jgi:NAD(P)-dependent dehydrogenase (short-subunit alcohol dehydrogenase family)
MTDRLHGKIALITGGCSGIGLGTVELFLREGARVVVADVDVPGGDALEKRFSGRLRFIRCDVREEADIRAAVAAAVESFGRLDVLFNNAGAGGTPDTLEDMTVAGWDATMSLLLRSAMLGMKHALAVMKASGGGAIINTSSVAGLRPGIASPAYSVAKAGINHLTRIAAAEFAPFRIRVNAICPGVITTPAVGNAFGASREESERLMPQITKLADALQPIAHAGAPRDIAEACLYLASDSAGFVTGSELLVDGGLTLKAPDGYPRTVERIAKACSGGAM